MTATKTPPKIYEGQGSAIADYFTPAKSPPPSEGAGGRNWALFDKNNAQHRGVMAQLRTLGWTVPHDRHGEVADMPRLSNFLKSPESPVKKPLKKMDKEELSKIIECFKSMVRKKYK